MSDTFDMTDKIPAKPHSKPVDTVMTRLRERLEKKVENAEVQLEVPKRPGVTILISPNLDQPDLKKWRRQAGEGTKKDFDANKFARIIVAQTCRGFFLDGEEVLDEDDNPVTFASPFVIEWLDAFDPHDAVKKLYVLDPHLEAAAGAILDQAGYGDEVNVVDPTRLS